MGDAESATREAIKAAAFLILSLIMWAVLVATSGRWDVASFYAWCGVVAAGGSAVRALVAARQPALLREREAPPSDRDRATRRAVLALLLFGLTLAGLSVRFGLPAPSRSIQLLSLSVVALGFGLVGWVLLKNPFASSAVRIQSERGHQPIVGGPYRLVRHPMYLAVVLVGLGSAPALGSWLAAAGFAPILLLFVRRTLLEDRMLHAELPGYAAYARRVRWRLVPFLF